MATNDNKSQENTTSGPSLAPANAAYSDPGAVSAKDRMLILTIVIILLILAAMAIVGFLFIKPTRHGAGAGRCHRDQDFREAPRKSDGNIRGRGAESEGGRHACQNPLHSCRGQTISGRSYGERGKRYQSQGGCRGRSQIINGAHDIWRQAQAATGITKKTYERMQNLFEKGVVSEQKRDEAKAAYDAAVAGESAAKSQYELAKSGAQAEDKQASAAMVNVAKGGVKEVNALLEDTYLTAPCDGEITVVYPNVSELIATGAPIMSLRKRRSLGGLQRKGDFAERYQARDSAQSQDSGTRQDGGDESLLYPRPRDVCQLAGHQGHRRFRCPHIPD